MSIINIQSSNLGTPLQELLMCDEIAPGSDPSYQMCKTIYLYHPMGAKISEAPIKMAQFKPRDIVVKDAPDEVAKAFLDEWKSVGADDAIFNTGNLARVYGVASLACLTEGTPVSRPLDFKTIADAKISFNVFDPLNTAGSLVLSQQTNSMAFLKSETIRASGADYHRSRVVVIMNEKPIYLGYTTSAFGYVGRSAYQRALFPMKSFIQTMVMNDLIATKAGVLIAKIKPAGSIVDNMMMMFTGLKRAIVQEAKNWNVISITPDEEIESMNFQNAEGPATMARKNILEDMASGAAMPAKILNAETFAEGFGEGTEDAKAVARYVDDIRVWLQPLYDYFDKIVMYRAWNEEFYATIQKKYPDQYGKKTLTQAFFEWRNAFAAGWPSLLTEPESEQARTDDVIFKAAIAAFEVLAPQMDPENKARLLQTVLDNFNERKRLFPIPFTVDTDALLAFMEENRQKAMAEPSEPKPFAANDAAPLLRAIRDAATDSRSANEGIARVLQLLSQRRAA